MINRERYARAGGSLPQLDRLGGTRIDVPEASGLAWDPAQRVLLAIGDDCGTMYEIALGDAPRVTKVIPLERGDRHDLEGIALTADGRVLVASEKKRAILVYSRDGRLLDVVDVAITGNKKNAGLEGLAVDRASGRIFAVHERAPRRLLELDASFAVIADTAIDVFDDLSSICACDGALWILSDDSSAVACFDEGPAGWVLRRTWSLDRDAAEGIEVVDDRLYVVFDAEDGDNLAWYQLPPPTATTSTSR